MAGGWVPLLIPGLQSQGLPASGHAQQLLGASRGCAWSHMREEPVVCTVVLYFCHSEHSFSKAGERLPGVEDIMGNFSLKWHAQ